MNILFICTSNKDRSKSLENYFSLNYSNLAVYKSAGINSYFCKVNNTVHVSNFLIEWADKIIYAEKVHQKYCQDNFPLANSICSIVLEAGDYKDMNLYIDTVKNQILNFIQT